MATDHPDADRRAETDRQLVARFVGEREEAAFREIVRRHGPLVLGVCRRVLGEAHEAEDAFQATFLVLARDVGKIRKPNFLAGWLHGVAYRISLQAAKRKSLHMEQRLDDLGVAANGPTVLDHIAHRHDERMIDEELSKLPAADRESLTLRYLEDRSNNEIAAALEISVAAVEGRLKRARNRLRHRLLLRGVSLSGFCAIVAASRVELQAVESLMPATVQLGLSAPNGSGAGNSYPHELAATEIGEMALSVKSIMAVAAVCIVAIGLGLYGLSGRAVGQESVATEAITVNAPAESPPPARVQVVANQAATSQADTLAAPNAPARTSRRLQAFQKISAALDKEVVLEFNESPLSEVVNFLKNEMDIPITIDRRGLDEVGMGSDTPVTVSLAGISLRSCLAQMLDELQLEYVISNEVLVITSNESAEDQLDPRIYRVEGLQITDEKLIEIITSMIAPAAWDAVGGPGRITSLGGNSHSLAIAQTDRIHDQISDLLEKLRQANVTVETY
ncbi:MAG: RNA polymerase sigma factor [Pirellulaceae bacterium]